MSIEIPLAMEGLCWLRFCIARWLREGRVGGRGGGAGVDGDGTVLDVVDGAAFLEADE